MRAAEAFTEDGTLPCKVIVRVLVNMDYLLFKKMHRTNRQYCMDPRWVHITHATFVTMHPFCVTQDMREFRL